jgi:hypothetical protein
MTDARLATDTGDTAVEPETVQRQGVLADMGAVLRAQRKTVVVAVVLAIAGFWVFGPLGFWGLAGCLAAGVLLGLGNHLATEIWLKRVISSGDELSRNQMIRSTFVRLTVLTLVAVGVAVAFWPSGLGVLFGLAIFRLIALVMTTIPLLRELKEQDS